jgi:hypothetical protein
MVVVGDGHEDTTGSGRSFREDNLLEDGTSKLKFIKAHENESYA